MYSCSVNVNKYLLESGNVIPGYIVQQFTGLYDAFKNEIYEGDIVAPVKELSEWLNHPLIVGWHEKKGRWYYTNQDVYRDMYQVGKIANNSCKVIGNIFENPELIPKDPFV